jgi:hypothetical protein
MLSLNARGQRFDQSHEGLELLEVEKRSQTEAPENRQGLHGKEVRVNDLANLSEHLEGSHLL